MATQPQAASTNPQANTPENFGIADTGERFDVKSPEVQAFQTAYPGMSEEAAIGSAIMQAERAKKPSMISSQNAKDQVTKDTAKLDEIVQQKSVTEPATEVQTTQPQVVEGDVVQQEEAPDPYMDKLLELQESANLANANLIKSIQAKYARRKEQQRDISKRRQAGLTLIGQRAGRQRYAPEIQEGILSAEERAGVQALADLDAEEQTLIAQAEQAKLAQDFKILSEMMGRYDDLQKRKTEEAQRLFNNMVAQERLALSQSQFEMNQAQFQLNIEKYYDERARKGINDMLTLLDQGVSVDSMNPEVLDQWEYSTGMNREILTDIEKVKAKARSIETAQDQLAMNAAIVDIIMSIPEGEEIKVGDKVYKGRKKIPGVGIPEIVEINGKDYQYDTTTGFFRKPQLLSETPSNDPVTGAPTDPTKVFDGYNFTSYATDPRWGHSIQKILDGIGKFSNLAEVDQYIKEVSPKSPINSENISMASQQFGVPLELLVGILQHESYLGTSNVAMNNNNPGGITWNGNNGMKGTARPSAEGGHYVKFPTMQEGVNAVASNIARRRQVAPEASSLSQSKKDIILSQAKNGLITKTQLSKVIESAEDPEFISQLEYVINSPKNKEISESVATQFNTPSNITRGQLDLILEQRELNGFGNKYFQGIDNKEYDNLAKWQVLTKDLVDLRALKEGGDYIKTLPVSEQERILIEHGDVLGVESIKELRDVDDINTGPVEARMSLEFFGLPNKRNVAIDAISNKYTADYMKSISGVAISEKEAIRLQKFLPLLKQQDFRYIKNAKELQQDLKDQLIIFANKSGFETIDELFEATRKTKSGEYFNVDEKVIDSFGQEIMPPTIRERQVQEEFQVEQMGASDAEIEDFLNSF